MAHFEHSEEGCVKPGEALPDLKIESPKKLYAITRGDYSDYHICAITSDPERAKQLKLYYTNWHDEAEIEEYIDGDPNSGDCSNLRPIWRVTYLADIGKSYWRVICKCYTNEPYQSTYHLAGEPISRIGQLIFSADIDAENEEKALKIAQDQYAKMKAEKLGL